MVKRMMRPPLRLLVLLLVLLILMTPVSGVQANILRLYGEDNVGTASGQFMKLPVGARAVSLGQAYVACATDGAALFWNPAGIMKSPGRSNYFAGHVEYAAEIDLDYLSWHHRRQNYGFGLTMGTLRSGDILRTDEFHQEGTGTYFNANQFYLGATMARSMTDKFSIGMTAKYFQENLAEYQTKALVADLGILYFVGFGDTRIGFAVRNFGPDMKPSGTPPSLVGGYSPGSDFQAFPSPTVGSFGAARTWQLARKISLLTTTEFNHPSDYSESFRMGSELGLRKMLFLRMGYESNRDEGGFAAGFGLQLKRKQFLIRIDYAYSDNGSFGAIHQISVDLSPLYQRKPDDAWRRRSQR